MRIPNANDAHNPKNREQTLGNRKTNRKRFVKSSSVGSNDPKCTEARHRESAIRKITEITTRPVRVPNSLAIEFETLSASK